MPIAPCGRWRCSPSPTPTAPIWPTALLRARSLLRTASSKGAHSFIWPRERSSTRCRKSRDVPRHHQRSRFFYDKLSKARWRGGRRQCPSAAGSAGAREAEDGPAAFAVIDGVKECRELLKQSHTFLEKLNTILAAPNRVRAFPELEAGEERSLSLLNLISMARVRLAEGLDAEEDKSVAGDMERVRSERRALQQRVSRLPVNAGYFATREHEAQRNWNTSPRNCNS